MCKIKIKNKNTQIACIIVIIIAFVVLMTILAYLKVGSMFKYSHNLLKIKCGLPYYQPNILANASHISRVKRIIHGIEAGQHTWPWMVSLKYNDKHICAGALIHPQYVLTASHCLDDKVVNQLSVVVGAHDVHNSNEDQYYKVSSFILHEEYHFSYLLNDIALVKLTEEVRESDKVAFMCIPDSPIPDEELYDKRIIATGWGETTNKTTTQGGNKNTKLHQTTLKIVEKGRCKQILRKLVNNSICKNNKEKSIVYDEDSSYCAEDYNTENISSNICDGDSGGPILFKIKNEWFGIAIASFSLVDCQGICNYLQPSYHTKLSSHLDWIFAHTRDD